MGSRGDRYTVSLTMPTTSIGGGCCCGGPSHRSTRPRGLCPDRKRLAKASFTMATRVAPGRSCRVEVPPREHGRPVRAEPAGRHRVHPGDALPLGERCHALDLDPPVPAHAAHRRHRGDGGRRHSRQRSDGFLRPGPEGAAPIGRHRGPLRVEVDEQHPVARQAEVPVGEPGERPQEQPGREDEHQRERHLRHHEPSENARAVSGEPRPCCLIAS